MLVLSRTKQQSIVVESAAGFDHMIEITVLAVNGDKVTLGIVVKDDVPVSQPEDCKHSSRPGFGQKSRCVVGA